MTTTQTKIMLNLSLWILFALVRLFLGNLVNDGVHKYTTLIDVYTVSAFLIAALFVFVVFGVVNRKSRTNQNKAESAQGMDLTLSEISSVLMNLGGLVLAVWILEFARLKKYWAVSPESFFGLFFASLCIYTLAYSLMPPDPQSNETHPDE